jgi:hypothetical protein
VRVVYIGNLGPNSAPHSTENHVARALEANGHTVVPIHENGFPWTHGQTIPDGTDFVLWTHTHGFAPPRTHGRQSRFLRAMRDRGIPTVSYHLDRYWDLYRETQVYGPGKEPFFCTDLMCSADGGNDERWADADVAHAWFPPGVSEAECVPGTYRAALSSDIAFVGSWQGGYHAEHAHRADLVAWLKETYRDRCRFWPLPGEHAIRGEALRDLYASVKVLVGDSCFAGMPQGDRYFSDRIPETLGRGGLLIHPEVPGVTDGSLYISGEHLLTWPAGDWNALRGQIDLALADDDMRRQVAAFGRQHVLANHTYEVRMRQIVDLMADRGLLRKAAA